MISNYIGLFGYLIWDILWSQFVLDWIDKATKTNRKAEIYNFFKMVFEKTLSSFSKLSWGTQCSSYLLENSFIQILNLQFISSSGFLENQVEKVAVMLCSLSVCFYFKVIHQPCQQSVLIKTKKIWKESIFDDFMILFTGTTILFVESGLWLFFQYFLTIFTYMLINDNSFLVLIIF